MDIATGCSGKQVEPTPALAAQMNEIWCFLSVVKAGYSRKCMFLRPTLHPSIFLVVGCNGAILVSQVPMMTLLVVYTDE